jgi:hypothetical protein
VPLTRLLIGTKGLFVPKSQDRFSEPGRWRLGSIVCSYPEPVRMMRCQNVCNRQARVSVSSSSVVQVCMNPSCEAAEREVKRWEQGGMKGTRGVSKTESKHNAAEPGGRWEDEDGYCQ